MPLTGALHLQSASNRPFPSAIIRFTTSALYVTAMNCYLERRKTLLVLNSKSTVDWTQQHSRLTAQVHLTRGQHSTSKTPTSTSILRVVCYSKALTLTVRKVVLPTREIIILLPREFHVTSAGPRKKRLKTTTNSPFSRHSDIEK